jgi:hypothetical protein
MTADSGESMSAEAEARLASLRQSIDNIDAALIHLLAERFAQPRRHRACDDIGAAAGAEIDDHPDRLRGPRLGVDGACREGACDERTGEGHARGEASGVQACGADEQSIGHSGIPSCQVDSSIAACAAGCRCRPDRGCACVDLRPGAAYVRCLN